MVKVYDLFDLDFINRTEIDYMNKYKQIKQKRIVEIPKNKKDLRSEDIILLALKNIELSANVNAEEVIFNVLKEIPEEVLTKDDKKHRRKHIRKRLNTLSTIENPYNLESYLEPYNYAKCA